MALTREQAWDLLNEYNKGEFHLKHGQIVGDVMRWYANALGYGDDLTVLEVKFTLVVSRRTLHQIAGDHAGKGTG